MCAASAAIGSVRRPAQRKKDEPIRPSSVIRSRGENEEEEEEEEEDDDEDDDEGEERRGRKTQKVQINEANVVACPGGGDRQGRLHHTKPL